MEVIKLSQKIEFKERLQEVMKLKGIRATDIADHTSIPKGAISYYLSGKSQPKSDRLHILAKYLNVSEAWLLGFDVSMERTEMQQKNDSLVQIIDKLRKDPEFFEAVSVLADIPETDRRNLMPLLKSLRPKQ